MTKRMIEKVEPVELYQLQCVDNLGLFHDLDTAEMILSVQYGNSFSGKPPRFQISEDGWFLDGKPIVVNVIDVDKDES